ncbi:hypothetical protein [Ancylobacter oerskovii]|uniref:Uncharacterized protein n=1 Tax=Ancylobacter oerskovii TaxID=459519 RepID=A0ABW4Z132_9HYPH|nr:hypothetical protein [Ancylobacter oerskovii]MBS7542562.1 hypothetical protein [Ancylobacter oerskovii]
MTTAEQTMIERVARAIAGANMEDFDETPNLHMELARAAVEALREVDDGFFKRVTDLVRDGRYEVFGESYPVFRNFMRGAVDAILNEETGT